jgi:pimeloyl-ACP methyl ester carboxylesterase
METILTRYRKEKQAARDRLLAQSRVCETSRGRIEAALTGEGSAVLVSHGSGGGYDMGLWLGHFLGGPHRYIAPSRFGYLRSPIPANQNPEAQADLFAALLDLLKINSVCVIGLSAGGASALQFALRHPGRCKGLVLISAISQPVPPLPPVLRVIVPLMLSSDFLPWLLYQIAPGTVYQANGINRRLLARIKDDPETMRQLEALYSTNLPSSLRRKGMLCDMRQLANPFSIALERIDIPALVIHAEDDPVVPIASGEHSASMIPGARFLRLKEGGHMVCVTHREEILPVIHDFLTSVEPGGKAPR